MGALEVHARRLSPMWYDGRSVAKARDFVGDTIYWEIEYVLVYVGRYIVEVNMP